MLSQNFGELRQGEVRRIPLPRTRVNKARKGRVGHRSSSPTSSKKGTGLASGSSKSPKASARRCRPGTHMALVGTGEGE
jgi:hypothetical protein